MNNSDQEQINQLTRDLEQLRIEFEERSNKIQDNINNLRNKSRRSSNTGNRSTTDSNTKSNGKIRSKKINNKKDSQISIGDTVEIRNRYKGDYGVSAFGVRGRVCSITRDRVTLLNSETGKYYTRAPRNLLRIGSEEL
jgi:hypothetical protein